MISKQYLCFAACLQIATKETANVEVDQVLFANHLGVVLPVGFDDSELTEQGVTNIRHSSDSVQWGITPVVDEINTVLASVNVLLDCRFEPISRFQDWEFEDRVTTLTKSGQFPIVGFDYCLAGEVAPAGEVPPDSVGHCAVVVNIHNFMGRTLAEIYDPGPKQAGFRTVDAYSLYRACRRRHGGIWSLAPIAAR